MVVIKISNVTSLGGDTLQSYLEDFITENNRNDIIITNAKFYKSLGIGANYLLIRFLYYEFFLQKNRYRIDYTINLVGYPHLALTKGIKRILYFHNLHLVEPPKSNGISSRYIKYFLLRIFFRITVKYLDEIIVQTEWVKSRLLTHLNSTFISRIRVLPFFPSHSSEQLHISSQFNIVYPSGYGDNKNYELALQAVAELQTDKCVIFHSFIPSHIYVDMIKNIDGNVDRIVNHGVISKKEMTQLIADAQLIIYPSQLESLGLGLVEAGLMNKPVLISDFVNLRCVIETPYIFELKVQDSLLHKMQTILTLETLENSRLLIRDGINELLGLYESNYTKPE